MATDPLAEFRKTPPTSSVAPKPKEPDEYVAFVAKDKAQFLEIRMAMAPFQSPYYSFHVNTSFDGPYGTNFVIYFTIMSVLVRGRNLQEVIFAIQNHMATFIQEFDPDRWPMPKNDKAPFIESIEVRMYGGGDTSKTETKH